MSQATRVSKKKPLIRDALSTFLLASVVLLMVMYFIEESQRKHLESQNALALTLFEPLGVTESACQFGAVGLRGETLFVSCTDTSVARVLERVESARAESVSMASFRRLYVRVNGEEQECVLPSGNGKLECSDSTFKTQKDSTLS